MAFNAGSSDALMSIKISCATMLRVLCYVHCQMIHNYKIIPIGACSTYCMNMLFSYISFEELFFQLVSKHESY